LYFHEVTFINFSFDSWVFHDITKGLLPTPTLGNQEAEKQIKTTLRFHLTPVRMAKMFVKSNLTVQLQAHEE
jgi:hypothetical protein